MGCRCSDISKCISDIGKIENISSLFTSSDGVNESVSSELNGLATECFLAFSCKNIQELSTEEKKLNITLTNLLPSLIKQSKDKVHSLKVELSSMKKEDRAYHEKEKKHHHDD